MGTSVVTVPAGRGMYAEGRLRSPRLAVIHATVTGMGPPHAKGVAGFFASSRPDAPSSAHRTVDGGNRIYRSVHDDDTAYAAPGANADGLHVELCFTPTHSKADGRRIWDASRDRAAEIAAATLEQAAETVAEWCHKFDLPARWLTVAEVRAGKAGVCDHWTCTQALGGTHWDVGAGFPVRRFMRAVQAHLEAITHQARPPGKAKPKPVPMAPRSPAFPLPRGHYFGPPSTSALCHSGYYGARDAARVSQLQRRLIRLGFLHGQADGRYGAGTEAAVERAQRANRLRPDGQAGVHTWHGLWRRNVVKVAA